MTPSITYAITVCDEYWELKTLLDILQTYIKDNDQVLVQSDSLSVTDEVLDVISQYNVIHTSIPLDNDFSNFKNNIKLHATGDWIFQLDADEEPTESLLTSLLYIIKENSNTEVIFIPRINTVRGITKSHINKWKWSVSVIEHPLLKDSNYNNMLSSGAIALIKKCGAMISESELTHYRPVINFPDYQSRLYQNKSSILWENKVHERLVGYESYATLPADISWCIMHHKTILRQESQNSFYDTILGV